MEKLRTAYHRQKESAKKRGIGFDLSYDQWEKIWIDSGKIEQRGRGVGKFCMMRLNDVGPYAAENVSIGKFQKNSSEVQRKKGKNYQPTTLQPLERLYKNVVRLPESGCHIWTGHSIYGYGQTSYLGKKIGTHRLSYLLTKGEIPNGMFVCHSCDVPSCINPDHLFIGSPKQNVIDKVAKNRQSRVGGPKGEKHADAKLTANDVLYIRSSKESGKDMAKKFGVNKSTISKIKLNLTWRTVC